METQDEKPKFPLKLNKVGITNLKTLVKIGREGKEMRHIPKIDIFLDLKEDKKGIHMSRLVESITETVEEEVEYKHISLEETASHILESLKKKHHFKRAEINFTSELAVYGKTPVSKRKTIEVHEITLRLMRNEKELRKLMRVKVLGNTTCPHSMEVNQGKPHIQRAIGILEIETDFDNEIEFEDLIGCVEESFSSRVYTLLKTEDESFVVQSMFLNPLFVEDVTRNMLALSQKRFKNCRITAKCISQESIHRHDVYAEGFVEC
ncbi:MAG: GTP cyclohydrolase, FolE2/MptA family [Candidatus Methanofastidiosia archaeon]